MHAIGSCHIFTYGSLMFPQVWERVVRGHYRSTPATITGFARYALAGATYPGMVAQSGGSVAGVLYFDVDPPDVDALDAFEGAEYRRDRLTVRLDSGTEIAADSYIFLQPLRLSEQPWRPEAFQMERFLQTYCRDKLGH
jgi:gamma-glutamylcyclotransferase (GGCT)/AIG2-like uncharacterized protein YtfP